MSNYLDRDLQIKLLEQLAEVYPHSLSIKMLIGEEGGNKLRNLSYLEEHGLVNTTWIGEKRDVKPVSATITAKGLDYISDDGGLTAELGAVTVKLHKDTLGQLMEELKKISASLKDIQKVFISFTQNH